LTTISNTESESIVNGQRAMADCQLKERTEGSRVMREGPPSLGHRPLRTGS
jgi:hypothetical protein